MNIPRHNHLYNYSGVGTVVAIYGGFGCYTF